MEENVENALRQRVTVQAGGRIEIRSPELTEGALAEVIVLTDIANAAAKTLLSSCLGMARGGFRTPGDVDAFIRQERDSWDS